MLQVQNSKSAHTFRKVKYKIAYKTNNTIRKHLNHSNNLHKRNDYNNRELFAVIAINSILGKQVDHSLLGKQVIIHYWTNR